MCSTGPLFFACSKKKRASARAQVSPAAVIGAVNTSEVVGKLVESGVSEAAAGV